MLPAQRFTGPPIATGAAVTVTIFVTVQPVPNEYVIVAVPGLPPVTMPPDKVTDATAVLLLLHVPPPGISLSVTVAPEHTVDGPLIAPGAGLTVTSTVAVQPVAVAVNVIMVVSPDVVPAVNMPVADVITAAAVLLLLQVPVKPVAASVTVALGHTAVGPVITGAGLSTTVALPVIARVQPVAVLVPTTVYTPATL